MKITVASLIGLTLAFAPLVTAGLPANTVVATIPVGSIPSDVVVSPDNSTIYIANSISGTISVIDAASNTVVNTFSIPSANALAISRDGSTLYVANFSTTENLEVVSTATGTITATLELSDGSEPTGLALSPDGAQLYVLTGRSICIIDTATNTSIKSLTLKNPISASLEFPINAVFTANGKYVYVNCGINVEGYERAAVARVDTASKTVVGNIALADEGYGIALNPANSHIFITRRPRTKTEAGKCELGVIIPPNDEFASTVFIPNCLANPIAFTPDGKYFYIAATDKKSANSIVLTIDAASKQVVGKPVVVGLQAGPIAIAPNGKFAYVVNQNDEGVGNGSVSVIDIRPN